MLSCVWTKPMHLKNPVRQVPQSVAQEKSLRNQSHKLHQMKMTSEVWFLFCKSIYCKSIPLTKWNVNKAGCGHSDAFFIVQGCLQQGRESLGFVTQKPQAFFMLWQLKSERYAQVSPKVGGLWSFWCSMKYEMNWNHTVNEILWNEMTWSHACDGHYTSGELPDLSCCRPKLAKGSGHLEWLAPHKHLCGQVGVHGQMAIFKQRPGDTKFSYPLRLINGCWIEHSESGSCTYLFFTISQAHNQAGHSWLGMFSKPGTNNPG